MREFSLEARPCRLSDLSDAPVFLQTGLWGNFKAAFGWTAHAFRVETRTKGEPELRSTIENFPLLVLTRVLRRGLVLAYVPHGPCGRAFLPLIDDFEQKGTEPLEPRLEVLGRTLLPYLPKGVFSLRFDLLSGTREAEAKVSDDENAQGPPSEIGLPDPLGRPFVKPGADVQPPDTVVVDLEADDQTILNRMKKKTRYNIRLAEKKGVKIRHGALDDLDAWYELYRQTGERDRISLHPKAYYRALFELAARGAATEEPRVHLLLAEAEVPDKGKVLLAGNVVVTHRNQGVYLYGASSNEHRNLMAPYALQWVGLKLAKESGCTRYDMFGIPPTNAPDHPMHGLYQFKTGFGGRIEHRHGAWDLVLRPAVWRLVNVVDRVRVWYFKVWKKR